MRVLASIVPALAIVALMGATSSAGAVTKLEPGNVNAEQPRIPQASANRTRALNTTYERKYQRVLRLLRTDKTLIANIKATAKDFKIDPVHIIGAIVGEHTYNVDALDRAQTYVIKAMSYIQDDIDFEYDGESVDAFIQRPDFDRCNTIKSSLNAWICRENVWDQTFRGKSVQGTTFPNDRFSAVFFQPFFAGQTFGIGQMNPLTALMMTDRVARATGAEKLDHRNGKQVYETIMDPELTLPYIAATIAQSIEDYRRLAAFDISNNPGITATLYNTGRSAERARALQRKSGAPQENYYGWLINDREAELRALLD